VILTHFRGLPRGLRSLSGSTCIQKQMEEREHMLYVWTRIGELQWKSTPASCLTLAVTRWSLFLLPLGLPLGLLGAEGSTGSWGNQFTWFSSIYLISLPPSLHLSDLWLFARSSSAAFGSWWLFSWGHCLHLTCFGLLHVHPDPRTPHTCMDTHNLNETWVDIERNGERYG